MHCFSPKMPKKCARHAYWNKLQGGSNRLLTGQRLLPNWEKSSLPLPHPSSPASARLDDTAVSLYLFFQRYSALSKATAANHLGLTDPVKAPWALDDDPSLVASRSGLLSSPPLPLLLPATQLVHLTNDVSFDGVLSNGDSGPAIGPQR